MRPLVPGGVIRVIHCPNCKTPVATAARSKYRCRECGSTFVPEDEEEIDL